MSRADDLFKQYALAAGYDDSTIDSFLSQTQQTEQNPAPYTPTSQDILPAITSSQNTPPSVDTSQPPSDIQPVDITQTFGQPSQYDIYSGGVNNGVDYATSVGTPVQLPNGDWTVEDAYQGADPTGGYIGDFENQGYGNSVVVKNNKTGEKLRVSHLSKVHVQPGQVLQGGLIGETGSSGNVTGPHADIEYTDANGQMADVLQSPYGNIIPHK